MFLFQQLFSFGAFFLFYSPLLDCMCFSKLFAVMPVSCDMGVYFASHSTLGKILNDVQATLMLSFDVCKCVALTKLNFIHIKLQWCCSCRTSQSSEQMPL